MTTAAQGNCAEGVASHIIVFRANANANVPEFARAYGLQVTDEYQYAIHGIAACVPAGRLNGLAHDPRVAYVEENREVHIEAQTVPTGLGRSFTSTNSTLDIDGTDDF